MGYKVLILVASGGGGHKATGRAIADGCALAKKDIEFEMLDLSVFFGVGMVVGDAVYNWLLSSGRARWMPTWHAIGRTMTSLNDHNLTEQIRAELSKRHFDAIISCTPFINTVVCNALSAFKPTPPLITVLSDFETSVDHPWMQDHRQYLVCGTEKSLRQAEAFGHPSERVYGTSGMIVHPSFYEPLGRDRGVELASLGLEPSWRTACVFFGGFAPVFLPTIVARLRAMDEPLNVIVLGGHNKDDVERALIEPSNPSASRLHIVGFTTQVPHYLKLADFLIGKPGPGVTSEAMVCRLPVIVELSEEHTPPQEKAVAEFIERSGIGVVVRNWRELVDAIAPQRIAACREKLQDFHNNAVFEFPHILSGILDEAVLRRRRINSATGADILDIAPRTSRSSSRSMGTPSMGTASIGPASSAVTEPMPLDAVAESIHDALADISLIETRNGKWEQLYSISIHASSYVDYAPVFEEPLRLHEQPPVNPRNILINASGRWGHDVIYYSLGKAADPNSIEVHFTTGYQVTWMKELVVSNGTSELHRLTTRNEDRGPKLIVVAPDDFDSGNMKLDFYKAGFLGVRTHGYTRYIDAVASAGLAIHILWAHDRYSSLRS